MKTHIFNGHSIRTQWFDNKTWYYGTDLVRLAGASGWPHISVRRPQVDVRNINLWGTKISFTEGGSGHIRVLTQEDAVVFLKMLKASPEAINWLATLTVEPEPEPEPEPETLRIVTFHGHELRVFEHEGQDWFVAPELGRMLDPSYPQSVGSHYPDINPADIISAKGIIIPP